MKGTSAAFLLGVATGERTFLGPAALAWSGGSTAARGFFSAAEAGELVGDILPSTGSRTEVPPLIARIVSGLGVGITVARRAGMTPVRGAIASIAGTLVGTYGGAQLRERAIAAIGAAPAALLEDALAIGLAGLASTLLRDLPLPPEDGEVV